MRVCLWLCLTVAVLVGRAAWKANQLMIVVEYVYHALCAQPLVGSKGSWWLEYTGSEVVANKSFTWKRGWQLALISINCERRWHSLRKKIVSVLSLWPPNGRNTSAEACRLLPWLARWISTVVHGEVLWGQWTNRSGDIFAHLAHWFVALMVWALGASAHGGSKLYNIILSRCPSYLQQQHYN